MSSLSEILQQKNTNTNSITSTNHSVSEVKNTNTNTKSLREVQMIAEKIEEKLGKQIPSRLELYYKIAWKLPEHLIWDCVDAELKNRQKGKPPHRLFSYLTKQYMQR